MLEQKYESYFHMIWIWNVWCNSKFSMKLLCRTDLLTFVILIVWCRHIQTNALAHWNELCRLLCKMNIYRRSRNITCAKQLNNARYIPFTTKIREIENVFSKTFHVMLFCNWIIMEYMWYLLYWKFYSIACCHPAITKTYIDWLWSSDATWWHRS